MSYADVIRMAADLGADGVDLTAYWLADTNDETLFPLKKLAYRSGIAIYAIGVRASMAQPTAELQAGGSGDCSQVAGRGPKAGLFPYSNFRRGRSQRSDRGSGRRVGG